MLGNVARARMANGHGRIRVFRFLAKDRGHRFAHNFAAAKNHDLGAVSVRAGTNQEFLDARRRAWTETGGISEHELADVDGMKTVHIFFRRNSRVNDFLPDGRGQWSLHEDA